jgi:hypothetical protein
MIRKVSARRPPRRGHPGRRPPLRRPAWLLPHQIIRPLKALTLLAGVVATVVVVWDAAAYAAAAGAPVPLAADSVEAVVNNIRTWLVTILVAVATLFLTVGGLRYLAANGDPGEVEKAKLALKSAALGYALAMLAPLFVTIIGGWVA